LQIRSRKAQNRADASTQRRSRPLRRRCGRNHTFASFHARRPRQTRPAHNAFQVPQGKSRTNHNEENRRANKSPSETLKQSAIAVGANHPRQVVSHCTECRHKEINVFGSPEPLGGYKDRHQQQWRADVKNQVPPTVQNPQITLSSGGCRNGRSRHSLRR
jgi:hypothetical protein